MLLQLAILSNRTLIFPDAPCEAGWMLKREDTSACDGHTFLDTLFTAHKELMPYAALVRQRVI